MADETPDFRELAKKSGYEVLPKSDLDQLRKDQNALKDFRAKLPEDFQSDPGGFFEEAKSAFNRLKEIETQGKSELEKMQGDLTSLKSNLTKTSNERDGLKSTVDSLKKENKQLLLLGHLMKAQQFRNIAVDDAFISQGSLDNFDLGRFDTTNEEGFNGLQEALWKEILEPAAKRQDEVISRVTRSTPARDERNMQPNDRQEREPQTLPGWGSKA